MENNIQKLRKQKGLTMKDLADLAGTSQQQIDRLEKGTRRITAEWMERLSKALSCRPTDIINFSTPETKPGKVATATATVIGAIETKFSNMVRKFTDDEQYQISFRPSKKDQDRNFFALIVEGGNYGSYPENSELIFAESSAKKIPAVLAENLKGFISGKASKEHKFEIGGTIVYGYIVKSIRSE